MTPATRAALVSVAVIVFAGFASAEAPVAKYIFPAGGRQGTAVEVRVGGLDLHRECNLVLTGPGVRATPVLKRTKTLWFEGPLLPLPDSQQQEDYPKDMAGRIEIAPDTPPGERPWRLWTSQGATPALKFVVGTLPEVVEEEVEGEPIPVGVTLPMTVNGRIFPREDVDVWAFDLKKGQSVTARVAAASLGSPLDARLEAQALGGKLLTDNDDANGPDPMVRFTAPADGRYTIRIHDVANKGGQAYVYRLTITSEPVVDHVYPLGGRRGGTVALELTGQGMPAAPVAVAVPADAPPTWSAPLTLAGRRVEGLLLDTDELPEHLEAEPNETVEQVKPVELPCVANGRVGKPGDVDLWTFRGVKGQPVEIELRALRLGSSLAGTLAVLDAGGKELAKAEAGPTDPSLRFTPPGDGVYAVRVADPFRNRGGPAFAYRLRLARPGAPDYRLRLAADAVTLPRGGSAKLRVQADRLGGFTGPIALALDGLPEGVKAAGTSVAANQNAADVTLTADKAAKVGGTLLTVRGTATVADRPLSRIATLGGRRGEVETDAVLLGVAVPTPFKVVGDYDLRLAPRGQVHTRRYRVERDGYDGPLEVCLADKQARHLQGVTGPTITVPAGATEFDYPVLLPPWMETGRTSRSCVMAIGVVKDADGSEHVVSFTSQAQNEQVIAVVEPGRLGLEIARDTLVVEPGKATVVAFKVLRGKGLEGAAKVELILPAHYRGVSADAVELPADRGDGSLTVRFAADARGPFNCPVTVRATVTEQGRPVLAEARLEFIGR